MDEKPRKIIRSGAAARAALLSGANKVADAVRITLGPAGRNVIIGRKFRTPEITNDGVTIANQIVLEDEIENLGAQALI